MYEFCYQACNNKCIGNTDQNFGTRVQEHSGSDKKSKHFNYGINLHSLPPSENSVAYLGHVKFSFNKNTNIIDSGQNWVELCFLDSLHIEWKKPKPSSSIKATKELVFHS